MKFCGKNAKLTKQKVNFAHLTGFTLIELLVVIAIIALLMSILTPALSKAKQQTRAAICLSNMHEWGIMWSMYTGDHKNRFWFGDEPLRWVEPLKPYFENDKMLLCPSATKPMEGGGRGGKFRAWTDGGNIGSYGINYWITYSTGGGRIDALLWKTPNAKGAAYAPMFFDCAVSGCCPLHTDQPPAYDGQIYFSHPQDIDEMRALCLNRHLKHVNITFLDFSARRAGLKELWELKWHRNWNPNNDPPRL